MEGGPMSVVEALAMGKPILARAGVGMVDDYEAVIAYKDDDDLIRMLQRLWDERQLGLYEVYGWDVWAGKHYEVFKSVADMTGVDVTYTTINEAKAKRSRRAIPYVRKAKAK
jgi:glycosyltransferase involved in cell wall biosynthesis